MSKLVAIVFTLSLLMGCAEKPMNTWYEYESTTSRCAKIYEFSNRLEIEPINCHKVPEGKGVVFKTVNKFGHDPDEEDE